MKRKDVLWLIPLIFFLMPSYAEAHKPGAWIIIIPSIFVISIVIANLLKYLIIIKTPHIIRKPRIGLLAGISLFETILIGIAVSTMTFFVKYESAPVITLLLIYPVCGILPNLLLFKTKDRRWRDTLTVANIVFAAILTIILPILLLILYPTLGVVLYIAVFGG